jgi:polar amino acid transport system ATP-binding protein
MSHTPIAVRGLRKAFAGHLVLDGIDLDIANGERIAILGPSGGGKTTLLRILCALEQPDAGEVRVGDHRLWPRTDRAEHERARRLVGLIFQQFNLFPHLSVRDNLTLAPRLAAGRDREEAGQEAMVWLERVGLAAKATAFPATLSGGQRQRVAIARALMMHPEVLCFDEPTSALDPELVGEVVAVVRDLALSSDMTMVLVTHQVGFARAVTERAIVLAEGQVVEDGPSAEVLENPQQERTRRFLGAVGETRQIDSPADGRSSASAQ